MQNPITEAKAQLRELIYAALGRAVAEGQLLPEPIPTFSVEIPADNKNGDFATNVALVSAKAFRMPPRKAAEIIAEQMILDGSYFEKTEVAGPGFINFFLSPDWYGEVLASIDEQGEDYGRTDYGKGKKVLVEFVSANPTGPMHIGNARGGAIGDSLASVLEWSGHTVEREFYINDAGNQINKFGLSLSIRYQQLYKPEMEMPEEAYLGEDITMHAKEFSSLYGDSLMQKSEEERRSALISYALPINIEGLKRDLLQYRISYDTWFLESTLHKSGEVSRVVELFKEKGCTYESEGALWFRATDYGADADFVLVRSNGVPTYVVPDIVYHYNKLVTRGFDKAIDVLGADHHGYVPRLKAALSALSVDPSRLDVVLMQMVRLVRGGEIIKASKRSGKAITLVTLLEEVPVDAARFFFNQREANTQMDFDLDLAVEESSQNPVYYVQYAHARICSILAKLSEESVCAAPAKECKLSKLCEVDEMALIAKLAALPSEIIESAALYNPSAMTRYATELATLFHKFYNSCKVRCDDAELMQARICLCKAVKTALANLLTLFKITAPTAM